jgi:PPM family protein phosphatase
LKTFAVTQIGKNKKKNEDRYLIKNNSDGSVLFAIADGLGGEVAGDYAAEIIMRRMKGIKQHFILNKPKLSVFVKEADRAILDEVKRNNSLEGMGSTLTCALLQNGVLYWAHVGDSRLFVLRQNELIQITTDQNMAQFLLEEGEISAEQARVHPSRNQLDQCVGCGDCIPDTGQVKINTGDILILTTDGLHGEMTFETFCSVLTATIDIETKAKQLIKTVSGSGGKDDMTIVIAEL